MLTKCKSWQYTDTCTSLTAQWQHTEQVLVVKIDSLQYNDTDMVSEWQEKYAPGNSRPILPVQNSW